MATKRGTTMPILSKIYCSTSETILVIRRRPNVANGGGFVVTNCTQHITFKVDGCGVLGKKEELILKDGEEIPVLLIRRKGSIVEALSITRKWKGFSYGDVLGSKKLVFTLKEPNSCFVNNIPIRISTEAKECRSYGNFEIRGSFPERNCSIVNSMGDVVAEVGVEEEVGEVTTSRDLYRVVVKPGNDQAFVLGVIVVLDYIYDGSTRC